MGRCWDKTSSYGGRYELKLGQTLRECRVLYIEPSQENPSINYYNKAAAWGGFGTRQVHMEGDMKRIRLDGL
jgi:hypothetical protein